MLFVERIQAFYQATLTELSQSSALRRKRGRRGRPASLLVGRIEQEHRPTLVQWCGASSSTSSPH